MHHCFQGVKAVAPLAEDVQQQVYLARRSFLKCHKSKKAPTSLLAPPKANGDSVIENPESAAHHKRRHITATESKGGSRIENRIGYQAGLVVRLINRIFGQNHSPP